MRYKVSWTEVVGYERHIEANSKEEALKLWNDDPWNDSNTDGFCQLEEDSVEVEEDPA